MEESNVHASVRQYLVSVLGIGEDEADYYFNKCNCTCSDYEYCFFLTRRYLFKLALSSCKVLQCLDLNEVSFGDFFEILPYENDFILHGEYEIVRLSAELKLMWSFSGNDTFTTRKNDTLFEIADNEIHVTDWGGRLYRISSDGNQCF